MKKLPIMSRAELRARLRKGQKFCYAALYERQDFMLALSPTMQRPIRNITNEPNHHHRATIRDMTNEPK